MQKQSTLQNEELLLDAWADTDLDDHANFYALQQLKHWLNKPTEMPLERPQMT